MHAFYVGVRNTRLGALLLCEIKCNVDKYCVAMSRIECKTYLLVYNAVNYELTCSQRTSCASPVGKYKKLITFEVLAFVT